MAPVSMASSIAIRRVSTGAFCRMMALAMSSTAATSSALIGLGCEKSKRRRSGATSEPFCATCVPSTWRSASCSRCVAEWLARVAVRRAWSTISSTASPGLNAPFSTVPMCTIRSPSFFCVSRDAEQRALRPLDEPRVADLAAGLAIERRLVEHQRPFLAALEALGRLAALDDGADLAFRRLRVVAQEIAGAGLVLDLEPDAFGGGLARALPGLARLLLLLLHGGVEGRHVDADAARLQRVLRQVERKAVGVVQLEGDVAGEHVAASSAWRSHRTSRPRPFSSVLRKRVSSSFSVSVISGWRAHQLLVGLAHLLHQRRHQPVHQRLLGAQQMRMAHGAAHDAAQHVAAPFVGGQHAVGDQEARRAQVIGDHPVRSLGSRPWPARRSPLPMPRSAP